MSSGSLIVIQMEPSSYCWTSPTRRRASAPLRNPQACTNRWMRSRSGSFFSSFVKQLSAFLCSSSDNIELRIFRSCTSSVGSDDAPRSIYVPTSLFIRTKWRLLATFSTVQETPAIRVRNHTTRNTVQRTLSAPADRTLTVGRPA